MDSHADVCQRLSGISDMLDDIHREQVEQGRRLALVEDRLAQHHRLLYGSVTELGGDAGIVGMLRALQQMQRITLGVLTVLAAPILVGVVLWLVGG